MSRNLQDLEIVDSVSCKLREGFNGSEAAIDPERRFVSLPLAEHFNPKHELVLLGDAMDWSEIERSFYAHFASTTGRPALPPQLVAVRLYPQHAYNCSDEIAVNIWVETRTGSSSLERPICKSSRPLTGRV